MLNQVEVKILDKRIGTTFSNIGYASQGAAGLDLIACLNEALIIKPQERVLISSGIAVFISDPGYAAVLMPRSGLGHKKGIVLGNGVGLIDSDYQGEVKISCWNSSEAAYTVQPGERIAQLVFMPVSVPKFNFVDSFESTQRGESGFGSTGRFDVPESSVEVQDS
jgi:dUTP pyrophosphatase